MNEPPPTPADPAAAAAAAAKATAEAEKAAAEARTAIAGAAKAEREQAERDLPSAERQRDAESRKATAVAEKETATARQEKLASVVPDLSKVEKGSLDVKGEGVAFGSALAQRALGKATDSIAAASAAALSAGRVGSGWRVLVTSDAELAISDSVYQDVLSGLDELLQSASEVGLPPAAPPARRVAPGRGEMAFAVAPVAAAVASALPGVLSLLSANRTLSSAPVTVEDIAATAAMAGSLLKLDSPGLVVHDDVRLLPKGQIQEKLAALSRERGRLTGAKITLEDDKAAIAEEILHGEAAVKEAEEQLKAASAAERAALETSLQERRDQLASDKRRLSEAAIRIGSTESVLTAIETFTASLRTAPAGGSRSPLAIASLREQLHPVEGDDSAFTHVLFVKAQPGSAEQLTEDRPLWLKDSISGLSIVNVAYMLIEVPSSAVLAAGSASGETHLTGKIGSKIKVEIS